MANTSATRYGETAQKKSVSVMNFRLTDELYQESNLAIAAGTQDFLVAKLPAAAVITNAMVVVESAADSATTATIALGTAEGGAQLIAATDLKTVAVAGSLVAKRATGTGQAVYARIVLTGATTTVGIANVILEYVEYNKNDGEYTNF